VTCDLCGTHGGALLWRDDRLRVVLVDEPDFPGFCRVIWNAHAKEMTDLPPDDRRHLMAIVFEVERLLREFVRPDKINLASLGNMTPHLHWHVIPRWREDPCFPGSIWSGRTQQWTPPGFPGLEASLRERLSLGIDGSSR
jgi:diadenosine tetraphosphate (Ap4A) HIT family hydrolase